MIRPKKKQKIDFCPLLRVVNCVYTKLEVILKKRLNLDIPNEDKLFHLNHLLISVLILIRWLG